MTVREVFEKYKHLDKLLSDNRTVDEFSMQSLILFDLWQAVKKECQEKTDEEEGI